MQQSCDASQAGSHEPQPREGRYLEGVNLGRGSSRIVVAAEEDGPDGVVHGDGLHQGGGDAGMEPSNACSMPSRLVAMLKSVPIGSSKPKQTWRANMGQSLTKQAFCVIGVGGHELDDSSAPKAVAKGSQASGVDQV